MSRLLDKVAFRVGFLRVLEGLLWIVAVACAMLLLRGLGDRWLDFPQPLRLFLLVGDLVWMSCLLWVFPLKVLRKRETRENCALRIEKARPRLQSALISTVQLAEAGPSSAHGSSRFLQGLFAETALRTAGLEAKDVVPGSHLRRPALLAAGLALLVALSCALAWPSARLLLHRYLGFSVPLPTLTRVVPISKNMDIPLGSGATLEARAEGILPRTGRIAIRYETGEKRDFSVVPDPADPAVFRLGLQNIQSSFSYQFFLNDGHGESYAVTSRMTPQIRALTISADFPDYTGQDTRELEPSEITVLNGTVLTLTVASSQPLSSATWHPRGFGEALEMIIDSKDPSKATLSLPLNSPDLSGFSISLVNQEGVSSRDDAIHPITVTPDQAPVIKLLAPADPPSTLTAVGGIDIVAEISDDMGISEVNLCIEASDGTGEPRRTRLQYTPDQEQLAFRWIPGRESPAPKTGDTLTYFLEARDNNTATGPGVGESPRGTVTLVTAEEKLQEINQKLGEKASEINELRESQRAVTDDLNTLIQGPDKPSP